MVEIKMIGELRFKTRGPLILSEDQWSKSHAQSDVPYAATLPPNHDRWSRTIGQLWLRQVTCAL